MVIKNKKANKISKEETKNYATEQKRRERENNTEMMLLIYAASVIA